MYPTVARLRGSYASRDFGQRKPRLAEEKKCRRGSQVSLDGLKGQSTGNHGFPHESGGSCMFFPPIQ